MPRLFEHEQQTSEFAAHREVVEVALDAPRERLVLNLDRQVSMAATPAVDGLDDPSQARTTRLAEHPPTSLGGPRPVERERGSPRRGHLTLNRDSLNVDQGR